MWDYAAYLTAQENTTDLALSALPHAPTTPAEEPAPRRHRARRSTAQTVRQGVAVALHQLADRVQPA